MKTADPASGPLSRLFATTLHLVYPGGCPLCGAQLSLRRTLCDSCLSSLRTNAPEACLRCAAPLGPYVRPRRDCPLCRSRKYSFHRAFACGPYDGPLGELVRSYKYHHNVVLADTLADLILTRLAAASLPVHAVVSVPQHPLRTLSRGFDHARLLARRVAHGLHLTFAPRLLRRKRLTPRQATLSYSARLKAVKDAFTARPHPHLDRRNVLLVDDVMTTGATVSECARMLHLVGIRRVFVAVLARQTHQPQSPNP